MSSSLVSRVNSFSNERDHLVALRAARNGFRVIGDDLAVCPDQTVTKLGATGQLAEVLVDRIGVVGGGNLVAQTPQDVGEIASAVRALDEGRDWHGRGTVPVSVEHLRQIMDDRADRDIEIAIVGDGVHAVIDVADVATTDDRRCMVGHHQLVVHAAVDPAEVAQEVEPGPAAIGEWIEQTNLDIGVRIERGDHRIVGFVVGIIDEQAHPDPTISRLHHAVDDDPASRIAVPDVVLHVEGALGQVAQRQTDDEGFASVVQEAEA